jgi:hypothetical protein
LWPSGLGRLVLQCINKCEFKYRRGRNKYLSAEKISNFLILLGYILRRIFPLYTTIRTIGYWSTWCVFVLSCLSNQIRGINQCSNCVRSNEWMIKYILISSTSLNDIYLWCVSGILLLGISYIRYFLVVCKENIIGYVICKIFFCGV